MISINRRVGCTSYVFLNKQYLRQPTRQDVWRKYMAICMAKYILLKYGIIFLNYLRINTRLMTHIGIYNVMSLILKLKAF